MVIPMRRVCAVIVIGLSVLMISCEQSRTLPPTKNILVNHRLVLLDPENAEFWVNDMHKSSWFSELVDPKFVVASKLDVESIDQGVSEYLLATAMQGEDRGKHFKAGLENVSRRLKQYFGQFFLVETGERQLMVCVYSHVEACGVRREQLAQYNYAPMVADGNGANFVVYFDMRTNEFDGFHITGSQAGPFGLYPN